MQPGRSIIIITMTDANLFKNQVNANSKTFRKEMALLNVSVYPELRPYKSHAREFSEGCIPMALNLILKYSHPSNAAMPSLLENTLIKKPNNS